MFGLFGGSQNDIYGDQAGLSGGYGGGRGGGDLSNTLMLAGLGLMSSPRNNPMEGVMKGVTAGMALDEKGKDRAAYKRALYMSYRASGMDHQRAAMLAEAGDPAIGKLLLDQQDKAKVRTLLEQNKPSGGGADDPLYGGGGGSPAPRNVPSGPRTLPMPSSPSTSDSPLAPSSHVAPAEPQQSVAGNPGSTPFSDLVGGAEGTDKGRGYNESLSYGAFTGGPVNLTGMKVADVLNLQKQMLRHPANNFNSSALGRGQIVGKTLRGLVQQGVVSPEDRYDEATQEKLIAHLAQARGPDVAGLRNEWEGLRRVPANKILEAYNASFGPGAARPTQVASAEGFAPSQSAPQAEGFVGPDLPVDVGAPAVMRAPANTPDGFFVPPVPEPPPSEPAPQAAAPIGPQIASADPSFVPASNPAAPIDTPAVFDAKMAGLRGETAQAPTGTMTDAPRMVKTTREKPMGTVPSQSQAAPSSQNSNEMRRRAILGQARDLEYRIMVMEHSGLKAASEALKPRLQNLLDSVKLTDPEKALLSANVDPRSKEWNDRLRHGVDDKRPTDIQTYEYARGKPDFLKYQKEQNEAKSTKLSVNTAEGFATEQKKAKMKLDLEMAQDIGKQALAGRRLLPLLNEVERLADKTPAGWAGPVAAEAAKACSAVGIEVPQGWSNAELLQSISQRLVPIVREPGPTSEKELKIYVKAVPGLMQSADGRKKVVTITRAIVERANDIAKVYRQNLGADDLHDKLAALDKPIIPDNMRADIERLGGDAAPSQSSPQGPPTATGPDGKKLRLNPNTNQWEPVQ
jgi:hypothetical protein